MKIIFGTDWWTDVDDVVAARVLCRAHKKGEIELYGVCVNAIEKNSVKSVSAFLNAEGVFGVPVSADFDATDYCGKPPYQENLAKLPSEYSCNEDAEEAVAFYRRLLASSDEKVRLLDVGFIQVLANVLKSGPDKYSELTGVELFKQKVDSCYVMAGRWDEDGGRENNFCQTKRASEGAEAFCRLCPVPVVFLGWECGVDCISGDKLPKDDLLKKTMIDHGSPDGRHSWDPMTALFALGNAGYLSASHFVKGKATVEAENGANHFTEDENGLHSYIVLDKPKQYFADILNEIIG